MEETFHSFDFDSDGKISFGEYLKYQDQSIDNLSPDQLATERSSFDEIDQDNNGSLNLRGDHYCCLVLFNNL